MKSGDGIRVGALIVAAAISCRCDVSHVPKLEPGESDAGRQSDGEMVRPHDASARDSFFETPDAGEDSGGEAGALDASPPDSGGDEYEDDAGVVDGDLPDGGRDDDGTDGGEQTIDAGSPCDGITCGCHSHCVTYPEYDHVQCDPGCSTAADCCDGKECLNGVCGDLPCVRDMDCPAGVPFCDRTASICSVCTNDLHCPKYFYCDLAAHACRHSSLLCEPHCDSESEICDTRLSPPACILWNQKICQTCMSADDCRGSPDNLTCGNFTMRCIKQCETNADCYQYVCAEFGICTCD